MKHLRHGLKSALIQKGVTTFKIMPTASAHKQALEKLFKRIILRWERAPSELFLTLHPLPGRGYTQTYSSFFLNQLKPRDEKKKKRFNFTSLQPKSQLPRHPLKAPSTSQVCNLFECILPASVFAFLCRWRGLYTGWTTERAVSWGVFLFWESFASHTSF